MTDTTALAVRRPAPISGYNPPPSEDEFRGMIFMAKQLAEVQGFVPAHFYKQPSKILAAMLYGRDLGITPTNALQHIIVIEGKATADAQLMGMLVRRAGHRVEDRTTTEESTVTITRADDDSVHTFTFTMHDAQRAGLATKTNWKTYPQAMLFARALTGCARKGAQDALMGVAYTPEELGVEVSPDGGFTGEIPLEQASPEAQAALAAATAPEAAGSPPAAAIQPTPPAPSVEAAATPMDEPAAGQAEGQTPPSVATPPPTAAVMPLAGPAFSRRMGVGRSVGPAPKRTNVVTTDSQAAEKPATAPEAAAAPVAQAEAAPSQQAPSDLLEEQVAAAPVEDGLAPQRELLRQAAAELAHVNAILFNKVRAPLEGKEPIPVPPTSPTATSDAGLARLIDRDFPGRTLANLDAAGLQNRLELVDGSLATKRAAMLERGITEE